MANFDLSKYAQVKDRIAEFYGEHPNGSIRTFLVKQEGKEVIFEARVYRNAEEAAMGIYTSGWARELEGDGMVNKGSHIENCETSAIGRALANLDYCASVDGQKAPRPSREEMQGAQRRANGNASAEKQPWEKLMPFGRNEGTPLGDMTADDLRSARAWCLKNDAKKFAPLIADIEATLQAAQEPLEVAS
jgi:hypothetical protein